MIWADHNAAHKYIFNYLFRCSTETARRRTFARTRLLQIPHSTKWPNRMNIGPSSHTENRMNINCCVLVLGFWSIYAWMHKIDEHSSAQQTCRMWKLFGVVEIVLCVMWIYEADLLFPATLRTLSSKSFHMHLPCGEGTRILLWSENCHSFCASSIEATWDIADHTASTHWVYLTDSIIHRVIKSSFRYNIFHSYWPAFATICNTWHIHGKYTYTQTHLFRVAAILFRFSFSVLWKCLTKSGTQFTGNFQTWIINMYMHGECVCGWVTF